MVRWVFRFCCSPPGKPRVVQRGLARRNGKRIRSLILAGLATIVLLTGIMHTTGTVPHIDPFTVLWIHVATAALLLVPLISWHFLARKTSPRSTDLTRRNLLRLGGLTSLAGVLWFGSRSFHRSHPAARFQSKVHRIPRAFFLRSGGNPGYVMVGRSDPNCRPAFMARHDRSGT